MAPISVPKVAVWRGLTVLEFHKTLVTLFPTFTSIPFGYQLILPVTNYSYNRTFFSFILSRIPRLPSVPNVTIFSVLEKTFGGNKLREKGVYSCTSYKYVEIKFK